MGKTTLVNGMVYPVLTKELYTKHIREGWTVRRLRSKYGLTAEELDSWIKENIVKPKGKGLTKERYSELKNKGWTDKRIREEFNIFPRELAEWKKATFTAAEIEDLNLRKKIPKKEKVITVATKAPEKKVNTFEREYHEAIKEIEKLEEQNKRLSLSASNLKKDCEALEEKLKELEVYKDETLKLKDELVKQDYEIQNLQNNYSNVATDLSEVIQEANILKQLVKMWA